MISREDFADLLFEETRICNILARRQKAAQTPPTPTSPEDIPVPPHGYDLEEFDSDEMPF